MRQSEVCSVCGLVRRAHEGLNHLFSEDGVLRPKEKPKAAPANGREHIVVRGEQVTAARLATILHRKGIIDDKDLVFVLTGEADGSHLAPRSSPG